MFPTDTKPDAMHVTTEELEKSVRKSRFQSL